MALQIKNLSVNYSLSDRTIRAIDNINLDIKRGKILGIVGESGSGKSTLALSIFNLIDPPGNIVGGEIILEGLDLLTLSESQMRVIRGSEISMVFQNPSAALNPTMTIGDHIVETIQEHSDLRGDEAIVKAVDILKKVELPDQEQLLNKFPHQLSGGMKQRVLIALAMVHEPSVLIADEPTSALDVSTQAQILKLLRDLNQKFHTTIVLITHNLGIVAEICDEVAVMYAGKIMETGNIWSMFGRPAHPYTEALMKAIPKIDDSSLPSPIPGELILQNLPEKGCVFYDRCKWAMEICRLKAPPDFKIAGEHYVACYLYED